MKEIKKLNETYNLAFDIGSNSVGWAVVDKNMRLLRYQGQNMWGSRLFNDANSAETRRLYRNTRRRYDRRRFRIEHLQSLMKPLIDEVDSNFFNKLDNSYSHDKNIKYNLFDDEIWDDQKYFEKYPTIYCLRKDLILNKDKKDPRLIYLAIHHIVKKRGHFLFEGSSFNIESDEVIDDVIANLFGDGLVEEIKDILTDLSTNNSTKARAITSFYNGMDLPTKRYYNSLAKLSVGLKSKFNHIFNYHNINESKDYNYNLDSLYDDENLKDLEELIELLPNLVEELHILYSWKTLQQVLDGNQYLSESKSNSYETHKKDLEYFKNYLRKNKDEYKLIFGQEGYYSKYIEREIEQETLNNQLLKIIEDSNIDNEYIERCKLHQLFPIQRTTQNASVPYQVHQLELNKILENQSIHYPYLKENIEKFNQIFLYKIPYYVGPINDNSEFSTVVFKDRNKKITPYNLEDVVDLEKSAEKFMHDRISNCTYLFTEQVLPKNSLTYQRYEVLNELNGIRINGEKLNKATKLDIIDKIFMKHKNVTDSRLKTYLVKEGMFKNNSEIEIKGYQKEYAFSTSLSSFIDFKHLFDLNTNYETVEELILWSTLFEDDKIRRIKIEKIYPNFDDELIDEILNIKYSGWGRLSRKLLDGVTTELKDEEKSILDILEETDQVFNQIINNSKYSFNEQISEAQKDRVTKGKIKYEDIDELYASSRVKRGLWQSVRVLEEVIKIIGQKPNKVFIEFARSDEEKIRTISRKEELENLFKGDKEFLDIIKAQDQSINNRLYLYLTQRGKCMYTNDSLNIEELSNYHVDHIIPRSLIKDDSLDNLVLVKDQENYRKKDSILVDPDTITKNRPYWSKLLELGLIKPKKFYNLTRRGNDQDEEKLINNFINRQLVETRQISKYFRNILEGAYPEIDVHSIHASFVSTFRHQLGIYKSRSLNNYHHAKDAYMTACIGEFVSSHYSYLFSKDRWKYQNLKYDLEIDNKEMFILHNFKKDKFDYDTGEKIWNGVDHIKLIRKTMNYNDVLVTVQQEIHSSEFYDQTIYGAKSGKKNLYPVNKNRSNLSKYGGFSSLKVAHLAIVKGDNKRGTETVRLVNIPILYKNDEINLLKFLEEEYKITNIEFIKEKIYKNQLIELNGMKLRLASAQEFNNAVELHVSNNQEKLIYEIENGVNVDDSSHLVDLYETIIVKTKKFYTHTSFERFHKNLMEKKDEFKTKSIKEKQHIILEMLKVLSASKQTPSINLYGINLGSRLGRMGGQNLKVNESTFIFESITGLLNTEWKL